MNRRLIYIILFVSVLTFSMKDGIAQKTDTIIHINGNVLTGDFKKMAYGVATWKMDGMGTISLEEVKINTIRSSKLFEIKMKDGTINFGSFDTSNIHRKVYILLEDERKLISIDDIVEVYPIKRSFWMRTSGDVSLGLNYSKGSNVATVAFSGNLSYRKRKSYFEFALDDNITFQGDSISSSKADISFGWQRLINNGWSAGILVGGSQNSEMGSKLRLNLDFLGFKDISYNIWNRLSAGAGLSVARETSYDDTPENNDIAGLFTVIWKVYKYTAPKVWVDANISYLPYLTHAGRNRVNFNLNPQVSIIGDDLKAGFQFYYNYDSQPQSEGASTYDYGINLSLSYSFH